jgi:hypothetical protein
LTAALLAALKTPKPEIWQRELIMDALGYEPWPEQAEFHFDIDPVTGLDRRHKLVTGGEQAGKSLSAAMEMMTRLFWGFIFWIVAPDYAQAHNEFTYLEGWLTQLGLLATSANKPDKGAWHMRTITGQTITTKSAQDVATIAGEAPDGILFVEAGQAPYEAFLRCYGRTLPKEGWLCVNGTFEKDSGAWLRNLWKAAQTPSPKVFSRIRSFSIPSYANRTYYPQGIDTPVVQEALATLDEAHFNERFGGIPSHAKGLVHTEFDYLLHVRAVKRAGLMKDWEDHPELYEMFPEDGTIVLPIDTVDELWIDPGFQFGYSVLFVTVFQSIAVVYDEIYKTGLYSEKMAELALKHPRFKRLGRIIMDTSGLYHQGGNKAASQSWKEVTKLVAIGRLVKVADGIERTRISLNADPETGLPQLFFDPGCPKTCAEYAEGYKFKTDRWGEPLASEDPVDANNHSIKAIAYGLTMNFGPAKRAQRNRAQLHNRDKSGTGRTVAGWETLYENSSHIGETDPKDWVLSSDDDEEAYDASYEESYT